MTPSPGELEARGIEAAQRSVIDGGQPLDVWPDRFDQAPIKTDMETTVDFDVELTNTTAERQSVDLLVRVQANAGGSPQPFPYEVEISLKER